MKPKFQQRHYEVIAGVMQNLRETYGDTVSVSSVIYAMANMFRDDNTNFDGDRFFKACIPGANVRARK